MRTEKSGNRSLHEQEEHDRGENQRGISRDGKYPCR